MARRSGLNPPFPAPLPLFPLAEEPATALDMIPIVPDPTGRGRAAWEILSRLTITEGEFAGRRIGQHAPPWQKRLTMLLFGYVDEFGRRMLREAFICMSKKNGKTHYAAALALTKLLLDEEQREQVCVLAANRLQAHICFDAMTAMILADEKLRDRFEIVEYRNLIQYSATTSKVTAISAEMASVAGLNASLALVDELHLLGESPKGAKLVSQLRTGSVARREPLLISISTAPVDRAEGIFSSTYQKAQRVIAGKEIAPQFFAWICEVPAHLDPEDPANWHWSNPSLGYTLTEERLIAEMESARSDPEALRDFRSQNLNISPESSSSAGRWLALTEWDAAADVRLTLDRVLAESRWVYIGIDAGGLDDCSAIAVLGKTKDGKYLLWTHQWLSRRGYEKRKSVNSYDAFVEAQELTLFDGGAADIAAVAEIARKAGRGNLSLIAIDSYGATELAESLNDCGAPVEGVPQGWKLTPAIGWIERRLADQTLKHNGTGILRWNVHNCVVTRSGNAVAISKSASVGPGKIDGVAALLNAVAACLASAEKDVPFLYEFQGLRTV